MCFAGMTAQDFRDQETFMDADLDYEDFGKLFQRRVDGEKIVVPPAIDQFFVENQRNSDEKRLAELALESREKLIASLEEQIKTKDEKASGFEEKLRKKETKTNRGKLESNRRAKAKIVKLKEGPFSARFDTAQFTPVVVEKNGKRKIVLARFLFDETNPVTYNIRRDSKEKPTWHPHFGVNHAVVMVQGFYERLDLKPSNEEVFFHFEDKSIFPIACVCEFRKDLDFHAMAMVTHEPRVEVEEVGHSRSPVVPTKPAAFKWINPSELSIDESDKLLDLKVETKLICRATK